MANVKKYRCMNVGNCQTANENKTFEIADGADLICPDCKKDMIVEVKGGGKGGLIAGIAGGVVVAALATCWGLGVFSGSSEAEAEPTPVDTVVAPVETVETDTVAPVDTVATPVVTEETDKAGEPEKTGTPAGGTATASADYLTGYALPYGTYTGPAKNGKPNGIKGDVKVTKSYSLDLHNGESLQLSKGDVITQCKFVDGKLVSGMLKRTDGTSCDITIGV